MDISQIKSQLTKFIRERFKVPPSDPDFTEDVHLFDYGYIDSFGAVELTNFVSSSFQISVSESDLIAYPLNTISEISAFIFKRKNGEI